jgi:hypothetical protein
VSVSTSTSPPLLPKAPTNPICQIGTPVSIPATVCYEGEGRKITNLVKYIN